MRAIDLPEKFLEARVREQLDKMVCVCGQAGNEIKILSCVIKEDFCGSGCRVRCDTRCNSCGNCRALSVCMKWGGG